MTSESEDENPDNARVADPDAIVDAAAIDVTVDDTADSVVTTSVKRKAPAKKPAAKKPAVKKASTKKAAAKKAPAIERPYPRRALEEALRVPEAIKTGNNGNPWPPDQVAKALGTGMGSSFFYLTQASRDFGLTEGGRDASQISLTPLGRRAVFPRSSQEAEDAKLEAFNSVDTFRGVVKHYGGSNLPGDEFVRNTLQTQFGLDPRVHDEFLDVFKKNCRFLSIGADWTNRVQQPRTQSGEKSNADDAAAITAGSSSAPSADAPRPVCFVIMPFVERTDEYATGFFTEVFASLFQPAIEQAGFEARTAKRQGSDVIQATIVNELLDSALVLCDLTEHNPNVLFELGVRMHSELPIALVKATGTRPIFDVDQMLRVESYNPNLWPSTVTTDVPRLAAHIKEAWATRETSRSYISILRQVSAPVAA